MMKSSRHNGQSDTLVMKNLSFNNNLIVELRHNAKNEA